MFCSTRLPTLTSAMWKSFSVCFCYIFHSSNLILCNSGRGWGTVWKWMTTAFSLIFVLILFHILLSYSPLFIFLEQWLLVSFCSFAHLSHVLWLFSFSNIYSWKESSTKKDVTHVAEVTLWHDDFHYVVYHFLILMFDLVLTAL